MTDVKSTNIELDRELLGRARAAMGDATIKETVEEGLRRIVAQQALYKLSEYLKNLDGEQRQILKEVQGDSPQ